MRSMTPALPKMEVLKRMCFSTFMTDRIYSQLTERAGIPLTAQQSSALASTLPPSTVASTAPRRASGSLEALWKQQREITPPRATDERRQTIMPAGGPQEPLTVPI